MKFQFVILAAGKGKRMGAEVPKTLILLEDKPILQHLIDSVHNSGVNGTPIIVTGKESELFQEKFGGTCKYAIQEEQLGTAHAVMAAKEAVGDAEAVIVLYGDHPLVSAEALQQLAKTHQESSSVVTLMTTTVSDFSGWHKVFESWGRILRDTHGHIVGIREYRDAMQSEQEIHEVNPALYCFDAAWLWENIAQVKNFNAQGEYYLTDLVELAVSQGHEIASSEIQPEESIGVNTPEELDLARNILKKRHA